MSVFQTDGSREGLEYDMNMIFEIYHNWTQGCAAVAWLGAQVVSPQRKILNFFNSLFFLATVI